MPLTSSRKDAAKVCKLAQCVAVLTSAPASKKLVTCPWLANLRKRDRHCAGMSAQSRVLLPNSALSACFASRV
eukprot:2484733-Pleurochrysis_carterae.AAC.2